MATSNIKLFDENKANLLTDTEYNTNTQRLNGVQSGVASSKLNNKAMYQVSLVAYAIGQLMAANGKDANDANAVSTFVANMDATLVQKVKDIASSAEAIAGVNNSHFMTPYTTKAAIENFYNTTIKEEIEELQAAVPWTKVYIGELTKTTTSIPFITGVPDNLVGLYFDCNYKFQQNENSDFANSYLFWEDGNLTYFIDNETILYFASLRNSVYSGLTFSSKVFLFTTQLVSYAKAEWPGIYSVTLSDSSGNARAIYFEKDKTSNLALQISEYIESISVKVYKLLAN